MRRSQRDAAKAMRKVQAALSSSPSTAGPSLLESIELMLRDECARYIEMRAEEDNGYNDRALRAKIDIKRGEIHGLARAVAKIRLPYEDQKVVTKQVEKEFIRKAKE
jgi:hypothetical protein